MTAMSSPPAYDHHAAKIMIVDDEPTNIKVARKYLELAGFANFAICTDGANACDAIVREDPDLILLDIMMPEVSGLDILKRLRTQQATQTLPVLILTAKDDPETKQRALALGATDFLPKPIDPNDLVPRVHNCLVIKAHHDHVKSYATRLEEQVRQRTEALTRSRLEVIFCLGRAAEYRDNETGKHVIRVGRYAGIIAQALGLDPKFVELIEHASPLHDVGKIGISDAILLKPGKLTPEEFEIMQRHSQMGRKVFQDLTQHERRCYMQHTDLGARIMSESHSPLLDMAASIALTHHEKWDGTGYPLALAGTDIPIEGRITAVADVYDALSTKRPYKPAFPREKCFSIMAEQRGKHFDPDVLDAFFQSSAQIVKVQIEFADVD